MELSLGISSSNTFGGNPTYALAGLYMQNGLGDYGGAIAEIEATACFQSGRARPAGKSDTYHTQFLPTLPYLKFLRKKKRFVLSYLTAVRDASFLGRSGPPIAEVFGPALVELAEQLYLIDKRVKPADDFDLPRFHADVARLVRDAPTSQAAVEAIDAQLIEREKARVGAMPWWDRMGVDWDDFHPDARRLLDDPLFWDCTDDYGPHGNDTGADLLEDFRKWNRRNTETPAHEMARALLAAWELGRVDPEVTDEAAVRAMRTDDPTALDVTNEAMIAVAFAAVKYRGCVDAKTRDLALRAIERERMVDGLPANAAERGTKFGLLADALRRMPEGPRESR